MQIQCPHCQKMLNAPDQKAGQVVNCPACGGQMQLPAASSAPPPSQPSAPARAGGGMPAGPGAAPGGGGATKACRFCGEEILAVAQKCKHCGSYLSGPMAGRGGAGPARGRRRASGSRGDGTKALIMGIVGLIICNIILGPLAIWYGVKARQAGETGLGTAGIVLGIVDIAIFLLVVVAKVAAEA